jgi:uncharacterized membrane protein
MKNKNVGILIVGISIVVGIIVLIFNLGLREIVSQTCDHGSTCSMYGTISLQTYFSLAIAGIILVIGLFFIFSKENERIIIRKIKEKNLKKKIDLENLNKQEREVLKFLQEENGAVFQATLMEKLGIGKVGMTRLIDKLEAKQIVERKRRGMNNIIVLK